MTAEIVGAPPTTVTPSAADVLLTDAQPCASSADA